MWGSRERLVRGSDRRFIRLNTRPQKHAGWKIMTLDLHSLGRNLGRRAHNRFSIPGAAISWAPSGQESSSEKTFPLSDIGRGGLSLLTNNPPNIGSEISIRVFLPPKKEKIDLVGKVIYAISRGPRLTYGYRVGVEFMPFEEKAGGNSPELVDVIERLERKYGRHRKKG
jgi:hypothetical protein